MAKIIDDIYTNIENDIEKIQTKPTMYISYTGSKAFEHLTHEIINNILDEYKNENNISDGTCTIIYDKLENMFYAEDTGRGIPFNELENACTILHSGSKMHRAHGDSAGENGVGMTATNALSNLFEITSYRNGKMKYLQFKEGKKVSQNEAVIKDKKKHGLLIGFRPSSVFLGPAVLDVESLDIWMRKLMYLQKSKSFKCTFNIRENGKDATDTRVYQAKNIGGFLEEFEPESNLLKTPIVLTCKTPIMEKNVPIRGEDGAIDLVDMERTIDLSVVINFKEDCQDTIRYSFCNDIENIEHGEHSNAVVNATVMYFKKKLKEENKKNDDTVVNNDILFGLTAMVNMSTDYSTGLFTGQTKHKMDNHIFYEPIRKVIMDELDNYFKLPENKRALNAILNFIRTNIKVRLAGVTARKNIKKQKSFLESAIIAGYYPPNMIDASEDENPNGCELYIVEGDSAGTNARMGRVNNDVQGVLGLGGKPTNGWKLPNNMDLAEVEKKAPDIAMFFNDILGCGMGKNFRIENCRYRRIIISSDADIDGNHICGVVVANIYLYARPLIEMGMVYRVITPLYSLRTSVKSKKLDKELYLYSKDEFFDVYEKRASDYYSLKLYPDSNYISSIAMRRFLKTNRDYYQLIDMISNRLTTSPDIIEYMAYHINDYKTTISERFPEIKYNKRDNSIIGSYDGDFHSFIIDEDLQKDLHYLHEIIAIGNENHFTYHLYKKSGKEYAYLGEQTIFSIMTYCQTQEPEVESRFKGLGELSPKEFKILAMNPKHRRLLRITILDAESTTETILDLFSESRKDVRKQMVIDADLTLEDIDN